MTEIGLHPNDADEEWIAQFDELSDGTEVTFLFDHGDEFHEMFDDNRITGTVTDYSRGIKIANLTFLYKGHTFELRIEVSRSGSTTLSLKVNGEFGGYPMELSW